MVEDTIDYDKLGHLSLTPFMFKNFMQGKVFLSSLLDTMSSQQTQNAHMVRIFLKVLN